MKIVYFTDRYAYDVMGTKRSIFTEILRRGHVILWYDKGCLVDIDTIIAVHHPHQIWMAHSGLVFPAPVKQRLSVKVVGFGFSDPYYFTPTRLRSYDVYVTNHLPTMLKYRSVLPTMWNPTACDVSFHKKLDSPKTIDVSLIGCGRHPRFPNKNERIDVIRRLRKDLPQLTIEVFGTRWNKHPSNHDPVSGGRFIHIINSSRIGLDIQAEYSPLAHRMFEYEACGTPIITRDRPEVWKVFGPGEVLTYTDYDSLVTIIQHMISHPQDLLKVSSAGYKASRTNHDVKNRVDAIEKFLGLV